MREWNGRLTDNKITMLLSARLDEDKHTPSYWTDSRENNWCDWADSADVEYSVNHQGQGCVTRLRIGLDTLL